MPLRCLLVSLALFAVVAACGAAPTGEFDPIGPTSTGNPPPRQEDCFDGVDGDGDGLSDALDPDCREADPDADPDGVGVDPDGPDPPDGPDSPAGTGETHWETSDEDPTAD